MKESKLSDKFQIYKSDLSKLTWGKAIEQCENMEAGFI
tara:strand:+ start:1158 stop:1271 length:114 start_codon:yes stop_codon:yes gene_type:complete